MMLELTEKNKWLIVMIISILILMYLRMYNYKFEFIENVVAPISVSVSSPSSTIELGMKQTVRKLEDYYTPKTTPDIRVINLKCQIENKMYYLGKVPKIKFNANCPICSLTSIKDSMLVLVNTNTIIKNNCYATELVNCYNTQNIADCPDYSLKQCDPKKLGTQNLEFILDNVTEGVITDGVRTISSYALKVNDPKNLGTMMTLSEIAKTSDDTTLDKNYIVCLDQIVGAIDTKQKVYLNTDGLPNDKIRFKMYFIVDDKIKYLGACKGQLCPNIECKDKECDDDYKFLCLYDDIKHPSVLIFEPELIRHVKL